MPGKNSGYYIIRRLGTGRYGKKIASPFRFPKIETFASLLVAAAGLCYLGLITAYLLKENTTPCGYL